jgi:hypothetical protein
LRTTAAVSIVEVLMAFLVLGLTILPVIGLFSGAGREAQHTADHTSSLALSAKVAEELRLAAWENPHFFADMRDDPDFGGTQSIVNGSSPFFAAIEDSAPPYGRLRAGVDAGIAPSSGTLFRELSSHDLRVQARGDLPPAGRPVDIEIEMAWMDMRGKRQTSSFDAVLPRLAQAPVASSAPGVRERADELIARTLFPGSTGSLTALAGQRGADLQVVRDVGDLVVIGLGIEETEARYQADLKVIEQEAGTASGPQRARMTALLSRRLEMRASSRFAAIEYLAPAVARLAAGFQLARLGTPAPPQEAYIEGVRLAAYLPMDFDWDACDSITVCRNALQLPADVLPLRGRTKLLMRMVRLAQLLALTVGPEDLGHVHEMLRALQALQEGRNANMESWARHELNRSRTAAALRASYARPQRLEAWARFTGGITEAVDNVLVASGFAPVTAAAGAAPAADASPGWTRARTKLPRVTTPGAPVTPGSADGSGTTTSP